MHWRFEKRTYFNNHKQKGRMKNKFLILLFAALFAFCSFGAFAAEDPCNPTPPEPPDPDPGECMSIELGE